MSDVLVRIKRAVLDRRFVFSNKARDEMKSNGITERDVLESVLNAVAIYKKIRSTNPSRPRAREYLYVIQSTNLDGIYIYTKGKFVKEHGKEVYYFFISSKRSV
ncbi:MAG: hypothetical protein ACREBD_19745 [Blastocatellia bacterium]